MRYYVEWRTEKGLDVNPGDFFETAVLLNKEILPTTAGRDEFNVHGLLLPGKRIAGFGRTKTVSLNTMAAGLGAIEVEPSSMIDLPAESLSAVAFQLTTNIILDQGLLTQCLCLHVTSEEGTVTEFPLIRPDVVIYWQCRGKYIVAVPL